jgi:hypothetical protein
MPVASAIVPMLYTNFTPDRDLEAGPNSQVPARRLPSSTSDPLHALLSSLAEDRIPEININVQELQEFVKQLGTLEDPTAVHPMHVP